MFRNDLKIQFSDGWLPDKLNRAGLILVAIAADTLWVRHRRAVQQRQSENKR